MNAELKYESDRKQNSVEPKTTDVNFGLYIGIGIALILLTAIIMHYLIK